jgi:thymidylate kinase
VGEEAAVTVDALASARRPRAGYPEGTLAGLARVLDDLADRGIRFCHWKSNEHLTAGLSGRTDLDLLVHRDDIVSFRGALLRAGLKELSAPAVKRFPGMEHWLGFDAETGRLFHLHVHERLVLGEEHVKNHHVPLEGAFLDSVGTLDGVPVPSPELELAVLVVRALLKYRDRDVVKDVLGIRTPGLDRLTAELEWLLARTTVGRVGSATRATGNVVPSDLVVRFLETYRRDPRAGAAFYLLRGHLRSSLRGLRRRGRVRASTRRMALSWRKRFGPAPRMTIAAGSPTIALVGADGSGKSTAAAELARWLGWKLDVRVHYLGSKSPSRRSRWSYLVFRVLRRSHRAATGRLGSRSASARGLAMVRDVAFGVHYLTIGHDRARRLRTGRRDARSGRVVLFDRFPLTMLSGRDEHLLLDGPRIRTSLRPRGRLLLALADREERMYRRFGMPDRLVVLEVSPEVSSGRKPDHRPAILAAKSIAARELADLAERSRTPTIRINADRPLDPVLLDLKRRLWDVL